MALLALMTPAGRTVDFILSTVELQVHITFRPDSAMKETAEQAQTIGPALYSLRRRGVNSLMEAFVSGVDGDMVLCGAM